MVLTQRKKNRFYNKAKARYPHLEFYWEGDELLVIGGIPNYLNIGVIKGETYAYHHDQYFKNYNGLSSSIEPITPVTPIQVERPEVQKPVSSWPLPGASAQQLIPQIEKPPKNTEKKVTVATMPQRGRRNNKPRRKPTARSRRYKLQNAALRPRRLPFKQVVPVELKAGYFDYQFRIKQLVPELMNVYEEMRLTSMTVVFLTNDVSVTAGLYTAILLDQDGYGSPLKSTATWFQRVSDMPGSVVHHATRGFRLSWKPTEPDSRNFVKVIDSAINNVVARVYMIGQTSSLAISGVLLIRGHVLCRGQYYDAAKMTVAMMRDLRLRELEDEELDERDGRREAESSSFEAI